MPCPSGKWEWKQKYLSRRRNCLSWTIRWHFFQALYTCTSTFFGLDNVSWNPDCSNYFWFSIWFCSSTVQLHFFSQVDLIIITRVYILLASLGISWGTPSKNGSCMILIPLVRNSVVDVHILYSANHTLLLVHTYMCRQKSLFFWNCIIDNKKKENGRHSYVELQLWILILQPLKFKRLLAVQLLLFHYICIKSECIDVVL